MFGYEDWKVEYTAEEVFSLPGETGRRIRAYLLIPRNRETLQSPTSYLTRYTCKAPFPGMLCIHMPLLSRWRQKQTRAS